MPDLDPDKFGRPWKASQSRHSNELKDIYDINGLLLIQVRNAYADLIVSAVNSAYEREKAESLAIALLERIIDDLPQKRDWLDPDVERAARALIKERSEHESHT